MPSERASRAKVIILCIVIAAAAAVGAWQWLGTGDAAIDPEEQALMDKSERMKAQVKAAEDQAAARSRAEPVDEEAEPRASGPVSADG